MWTAGFRSDLSIGEWVEDHHKTVKTWLVSLSNEDGQTFIYCGPVVINSKDSAEEFVRYINNHILDREKNEDPFFYDNAVTLSYMN